MRLWLDDFRDPAVFSPVSCRGPCEEPWIWVKKAYDAIVWLMTNTVTEISLDHDLGDEEIVGSGYMVAKWIEMKAHEGYLKPLKWKVHSANPVGRKNMEAAMKNAERFWEEKRYSDEIMTKENKMDLKDMSDEELNAELARRSEEKAKAAATAAEKERIRKEADSKVAYQQIEKHVKEAYDALDKAKKLADDFGLIFNFDVAYGMSGSYHGKGVREGCDGSGDQGWYSSSSDC